MNDNKTFILEQYKINNRVPVFVDLSNVAYRSQFVFTPDKFITKQGIPNGSLFGVCQNIKTLVSTGYEVYLCRDLPVTFRAELNENYKANRERDDGSISIHKLLNEAINPLISELNNVHVISSEGYEADDMMFSGAKYCSHNNIKSYILSTDKDLCQTLNNNITIESNNIENISNSSDKVIEIINTLKKYKVTPVGLNDVLEDLLKAN